MEKRLKETFGLATKEENLGLNFFITPWVMPNFERAQENRRSQIFRGGETEGGNISLVSSPDLGLGVRLYFQFLISMSIGLTFMLVFALPMFIFNYFSSGMPAQGRDAAGLYRLSLGNLGYEEPAPYNNFLSSPRLCSTEPYKTSGQTCISVFDFEFPLRQVQLILVGCEIVQVVILLLVVRFLRQQLQRLRRPDQGENLVSITHYAVYVDQIPPFISTEEVIAHFSGLYQLQNTDWRQRLPVEDARPVQAVDNTGESVHAGTWVAECTLFRRIGSLLRSFKGQEELLQKLVRSRAVMKRYAADSSHPLGGDSRHFDLAEMRMLATAREVDALFQQVREQQRQLGLAFRLRRAKYLYAQYLQQQKAQSRELQQQQQQLQQEERTMLQQKKPSSAASKLNQWQLFNCFKANTQSKIHIAGDEKTDNNSSSLSNSDHDNPHASDIEMGQDGVEHIDSNNNNNNNNGIVGSGGGEGSFVAGTAAATTVVVMTPVLSPRPSTAASGSHYPNQLTHPRHSASGATADTNGDANGIGIGNGIGATGQSRPVSANINNINNSNTSGHVRPNTGNHDNHNNNNNSSSNNSNVNTRANSVNEEHIPTELNTQQQQSVSSTSKALESFLDTETPIGVDDAEVTGAFVIFEYNESQARCLEDYAHYSSFPFSLFYPAPLLLRGHRLRVRRAPEPNQILYENLEYSDWYKAFLALRTALVTALLLLVCFTLVILGASLRSSYAQRLPSRQLCDLAVPALFAPQFASEPASLRSLQLVRPSVYSLSNNNSTSTTLTSNALFGNSSISDGEYKQVLDGRCAAILQTSSAFFAVYSASDYPATVTRYSFSACVAFSLNLSSVAATEAADYYDRLIDTSTNSSYEEDVDVFDWRSTKRMLWVTQNLTGLPAEIQMCPRYSAADILSLRNLSASFNATYGTVRAEEVFNISSVRVCPCLTMHTRETCTLAPCQLGRVAVRASSSDAADATDEVTVESEAQCGVAASSVAACFCAQQSIASSWFSSSRLAKLFAGLFTTGSTEELLYGTGEVSEGVYCAEYEALWLSSHLVEYGLILVTVGVNRLLKMSLVALVPYEGHASLDEAQRSVLLKLFTATCLNTGLVVLLAYGLRPPHIFLSSADRFALAQQAATSYDPAKLRLSDWLRAHSGLALGPYTDFGREWFGSVGFYFCTTLVFTCLGPLLSPMLQQALVRPLLRRLASLSLRGDAGFHRLLKHLCWIVVPESVREPVLQSELDALLLSEPFLFTAHAAQVLSLLTVACAYSAGLPLLLLLALFLLLAFLRLDTHRLLKVARRPPALDERILQTVFRILSLAVALKLLVGLWMFSNAAIFDPEEFWATQGVSPRVLPPSFPADVRAFLHDASLQNYVRLLQSLRAALTRSLASPEALARDTSLSVLRLLPPPCVSVLRYLLASRCVQPASFPLALLLALLLASALLSWVWRGAVRTPSRIFGLSTLLMRLGQCLRRACLYRVLRLREPSDAFADARKRGYVHPFELLSVGAHDGRSGRSSSGGSGGVGSDGDDGDVGETKARRYEAAPFTGIYYQFLQRKSLAHAPDVGSLGNHPPGGKGGCGCLGLCKLRKTAHKYTLDTSSAAANATTSTKLRAFDTSYAGSAGDDSTAALLLRRWCGCGGCGCAASRAPPQLKAQEVADGWESADMGLEFVVKVCSWQQSLARSDVDAQAHVKGQHKRTFEVLQQYRGRAGATYRLDEQPAYSLAWLALRDHYIRSPNSTTTTIKANNNKTNHANDINTIPTPTATAMTDHHAVLALDAPASASFHCPVGAVRAGDGLSLVEDYLQKVEEILLRPRKVFNPLKEERQLWSFLVKRWLYPHQQIHAGRVAGGAAEEAVEKEEGDEEEALLRKRRERVRQEQENKRIAEEEQALQKELLREMYGSTGRSNRYDKSQKKQKKKQTTEEEVSSSDDDDDDEDDAEDEEDDEEEESSRGEESSGDEEEGGKRIGALRRPKPLPTKSPSNRSRSREEAKVLRDVSSSSTSSDGDDSGDDEDDEDDDDEQEEDSSEESDEDEDDEDEEEEDEEDEEEEEEEESLINEDIENGGAAAATA